MSRRLLAVIAAVALALSIVIPVQARAAPTQITVQAPGTLARPSTASPLTVVSYNVTGYTSTGSGEWFTIYLGSDYGGWVETTANSCYTNSSYTVIACYPPNEYTNSSEVEDEIEYGNIATQYDLTIYTTKTGYTTASCDTAHSYTIDKNGSYWFTCN